MKNKIIILILFVVGITSTAFSQVYISKSAKPFNDITKSTSLTPAKRVSYDNAYEYLTALKYRTFDKTKFAGEYFLHDNMLVQLVVITQKNAFYFKPLSEVQDWNRTMASGGDDRPIGEYYTDFIKNFTGHKAYVGYFKENSNIINFVIQDNLGRYVIDGSIYHAKADKTKAVTFINTLLTSISFK
ncbi:hypothetical protein [Sphingobacterium anhuiense]|uniref:hypothetical protein n=1 Tax=Sphingobacterium anhuiense TaxID=493780 RepID=UPI003C2D3EA5